MRSVSAAVMYTLMSLAIPSAAPAANLVVNGNFENGTTGWSAGAENNYSTFSVWSDDGYASPPSGLLSSSEYGTAYSDCMAIGPQNLDFIASGKNLNHYGYILAEVQFLPDCTFTAGRPSSPQATSSLRWDDLEVWSQKSALNLTVPAGAMGARIRLAGSNFAFGMGGRFDSIYLGPTPDGIFDDGFDAR